PGKRVLDLGCGDGRTLVPIVEAGHHGVGVDRDPEAREACRARTDTDRLQLIHGDFVAAIPIPGPFDLITCLGHTWMPLFDPLVGLEVAKRIAERLAPGGQFVIDDFPRDLWPRVVDGDWINGVSDDDSSQMIWEPDDNVFTVREGDAVDLDNWTIGDDDPRYRLWTTGELRLLCHAAGLTSPRRDPAGHLLWMMPAL